VDESCLTCERVMGHVQIDRVARMNESRYILGSAVRLVDHESSRMNESDHYTQSCMNKFSLPYAFIVTLSPCYL